MLFIDEVTYQGFVSIGWIFAQRLNNKKNQFQNHFEVQLEIHKVY